MQNLSRFTRIGVAPHAARLALAVAAGPSFFPPSGACGAPAGPLSPACDAAYILDDGGAEVAFYGGLGADSLWLNRFDVVTGGETIVAVDVCWIGWAGADGALPLGHPVSILVLDDPDGDGAPADASPRAVLETVVAVDVPGAFQRVAIGDVAVGAAGSSFFVGVLTTTPTKPSPSSEPSFPPLPPGVYYPSTADGASDGTRSWLAVWPGGSGGLGSLSDLQSLADWGYSGAFLVRAIPAPPALGDLDCDGVVDGADLGALLGAWGPCPANAACHADLDGDALVGAADLGLLLAAWGA